MKRPVTRNPIGQLVNQSSESNSTRSSWSGSTHFCTGTSSLSLTPLESSTLCSCGMIARTCQKSSLCKSSHTMTYFTESRFIKRGLDVFGGVGKYPQWVFGAMGTTVSEFQRCPTAIFRKRSLQMPITET
jgi:hypothetical protein